MISADVSEPSVGEVLSEALDKEGQQVDVLVNCAGITHTATMMDTPKEKYQVHVSIGIVRGPVHDPLGMTDPLHLFSNEMFTFTFQRLECVEVVLFCGANSVVNLACGNYCGDILCENYSVPIFSLGGILYYSVWHSLCDGLVVFHCVVIFFCRSC